MQIAQSVREIINSNFTVARAMESDKLEAGKTIFEYEFIAATVELRSLITDPINAYGWIIIC